MAILRRKSKNQHLGSTNNAHITQELYKRNMELAARNKTLMLLRSIDEIVLGANPSTDSRVSQVIVQLLVNETDFNMAMIHIAQDDKNYAVQDGLATDTSLTTDLERALNFKLEIKKLKIVSHSANSSTSHTNRLNGFAPKISPQTEKVQNNKLKTLDALKDDFISMASHQLRTPASSVHEAIQMLSDPSLSRSEHKKLLQLAEASSEHLANVVVDMLSIARIQAGHFTIEKSEINFLALAQRAIMELSVSAEQNKIKIILNKSKEALVIQADRAKINEAMSNLLENAIKYSVEGSSVSINVRKENDRIIYEVLDSGIGVPAKERKSIFSKFFRARNARLEHPDGNGIGLFVVKTIAQAHGGDAFYKPQASGSLFGFWLPVL
jgi:signal transduction histidine kinase